MKRLVFAFALAAVACSAQHRTRNIIFVMTDGLRWQEVFHGADPALLNKQSGVENVDELKREFWREGEAERRAALFPFLWGVVARDGQVFGNRDSGAEVSVTNGKNFSYPGYSETFCGFADDRIDSNDKKPNPNVTVFEWLNQKPAFKGKVAAFGAWDVFPYILNTERSGLPVNAGYDPLKDPQTPAVKLLNRLKAEMRMWDGEPLDALTFHSAMEYLRARKPRVLYLSLGETDEWAHGGRYDLYLRSANRFDQYVKELWETAQSMPEYRGNTTLILSVDHGRGLAPTDWKSHGQKLPETKNIWMAYLGPDTRALGERKNVAPLTQSQIAATLAALVGEDYNRAVAKAAAPVADVLPVH